MSIGELTWQALGIDPQPWVDQAVCAQGMDPDLWFPVEGREGVSAAKRVCEGCPVKQECLAFALEHRQRWGIWGGLTVGERTALQRGAA